MAAAFIDNKRGECYKSWGQRGKGELPAAAENTARRQDGPANRLPQTAVARGEMTE